MRRSPAPHMTDETMNYFKKNDPRKRQWAILGIFAVFTIGCGGTKKNEEVDTQTSPPPDTETSSGQETDTPSETEEPAPEFPELCVPQTELIGGEAVRQLTLTDDGSGIYPSIAVNPETNDALFVFAHIDADTKIWQIKTAAYKTSAEAGEADGGLVYTRELKDVTVPSSGNAGSLNPSAVYGHGAFSMVWLDGRYNSACTADTIDTCGLDVLFLQTDEDGSALGEPVTLSNEDLGAPVGRPAIAVLPDGFLAVWTVVSDGDARLAAGLLDTTGALVDKAFLLGNFVTDDSASPSVAVNDEAAVIVYNDADRQGVSALVWPHKDDEPPEEPISISEASDRNKNGVAAAGAEGFLVAWHGSKDGETQILVRALNAEGEVSGDIQQATWTEGVGAPAVAALDDTYAVAWTSAYEKGSDECAVPDWCASQIFVAIVDEHGQAAAEPVRLSEDANDSSNAMIAWDGVGWTAVWQTERTYRTRLFFGQITCE